MKRTLGVAAVLALLSPSPAARAKPPEIAPVPVGIVRLLDDRGKAYLARDRDLLARTMVTGPFQTAQLTAFDNASNLRFATFRHTAVTRFSADIASPRVRALYKGKDVAAYQVQEETAFTGVETTPYVEDSFFTFVRDKADPQDPYDGWRLASGADFEALGGFSAYHVWDAAPVVTEESEHFLTLHHADQTGKVRPTLDAAELAYADVVKFWPKPVGSRYVVVIPSTTAELGKLIQATFDLEKFVAFAAATNRNEDTWEPAGVRMFVQLSHFDRYDAQGKRVILAHELIHAVSRPVSGPFFPTWVEEGLAMYGAEAENGLSAVRRGKTPDAFPTDDEFFVGPTGGIVLVYYEAQTAVGTLVQRSKVEGLIAFYEALGRARLSPGTKDYHLRRAVQESVGWTPEEWTKAWQRRVD